MLALEPSNPTQQKRTDAMTSTAFDDQPPQSSSLTDCDRQNLALYVRLLDAAEEGAEWTEVNGDLFGNDQDQDREPDQLVHDSHLDRALGLTQLGLRHQ